LLLFFKKEALSSLTMTTPDQPWSSPTAWFRLETEPTPAADDLPPPTPPNPCFAAGTRILTDQGEIPVEDLAIGDLAITAENEFAKIIWIGWRDLDLQKHPLPAAVRPIRIAAGALSMGIPERELTVSPDHGLYFDGSLVQAKDIVDGAVIRQDFTIPAIRYYHVELESHAILLAEGAGAESYLDTGHRAVFGNTAAPIILHPDLMQIRREAESIAPLVTGGEELAAIRARLHARKLMLGLTIADAAAFALKLGDLLLPPTETAPNRVTFTLPPGTTEAILCTPTFIPAEIDPASNDRRRLGVALTDLLLDGKLTPIDRIILPADLHRRAPRESATWTRGAARLRLPAGTQTLTLNLSATPRLWRRLA
jgi:hypothetical protein